MSKKKIKQTHTTNKLISQSYNKLALFLNIENSSLIKEYSPTQRHMHWKSVSAPQLRWDGMGQEEMPSSTLSSHYLEQAKLAFPLTDCISQGHRPCILTRTTQKTGHGMLQVSWMKGHENTKVHPASLGKLSRIVLESHPG